MQMLANLNSTFSVYCMLININKVRDCVIEKLIDFNNMLTYILFTLLFLLLFFKLLLQQSLCMCDIHIVVSKCTLDLYLFRWEAI